MFVLNVIFFRNEKVVRKLLIRFLLDMVINRSCNMFNVFNKGEEWLGEWKGD